jgi:hypothetical protein
MWDLGNVFLARGQYDDARTYYDQSLRHVEETEGKFHISAARVCYKMALVELRGRRPSQASHEAISSAM